MRLLTAVLVGAAIFLAQPGWIIWPTRVLVSWDCAALLYLAAAWIIIVKYNADMTQARVQRQDESAYVIFLLLVGAASASIVAIGFMLSDAKNLSSGPRAWHIGLSIVALLSSWLLIQTVFAFHYARRYYVKPERGRSQVPGLVFPNDVAPDYLDFAYYAFVVGMTSQVSDVQVTSRQMRRLTLSHSVLSFVFNMAVLAMSVNIIGGSLA